MTTPHDLANQYGNVDVSQIPEGFAHVNEKRLGPLCHKLKIDFVPAMCGFRKVYGGYKAIIEGVVVSANDLSTLMNAIDDRAARRKTPEQRAAAKRKRQERETARFAAEIRRDFPSMPESEEIEIAEWSCEIGSGRVGRSSTADDPVMAAVVAHVRHNYTDYDKLLRDGDREFARDMVGDKISQIIDEWRKPQQATEEKQ